MAHCGHQSSWVSSVDCHVSITFQPSRLVRCCLVLSSARLTPPRVIPIYNVNTFLLPSHHVTLSTSLNCFVGYIACIRFTVSVTLSVISYVAHYIA